MSKEKKISKELLTVTGDGSRKTIIKSLLKKKKIIHKSKSQTFKIAKSPLFDELSLFLPQLKESNNKLMDMTEDEKKEIDMENVEGCSKYIEMDVLMGQLADSSSDSDDDAAERVIQNLSSHNQIPSKVKSVNKLITEIGSGDEGDNNSVASSPSTFSGASR